MNVVDVTVVCTNEYVLSIHRIRSKHTHFKRKRFGMTTWIKSNERGHKRIKSTKNVSAERRCIQFMTMCLRSSSVYDLDFKFAVRAQKMQMTWVPRLILKATMYACVMCINEIKLFIDRTNAILCQHQQQYRMKIERLNQNIRKTTIGKLHGNRLNVIFWSVSYCCGGAQNNNYNYNRYFMRSSVGFNILISQPKKCFHFFKRCIPKMLIRKNVFLFYWGSNNNS